MVPASLPLIPPGSPCVSRCLSGIATSYTKTFSRSEKETSGASASAILVNNMDVDSTAAVVVYFHCSGNMNISNAVDSLAALAQETRLNIFRLLVRNAPQGVPAGTIARRLKLPGPTLSFHLNALAATELIKP